MFVFCSVQRYTASNGSGHRFKFCCLHQKERHLLFADVFLFGFRSRWSLHPLVIIMLGGNEFRLRRGFASQNARTAQSRRGPEGPYGRFPVVPFSNGSGHRFKFCCLHQKERHLLFADVFLFGFRSRWSLHPLVIIMLGGNEFRLRRGFASQNARTAQSRRGPEGPYGRFPVVPFSNGSGRRLEFCCLHQIAQQDRNEYSCVISGNTRI